MMAISSGASTKDLSNAMGISSRAVLSRASKERWAYREGPRGRVWDILQLPPDVQAVIVRAPDRIPLETAAMSGEPTDADVRAFKQASERNRERALLRSALISSFRSGGQRTEDFVADYNAGRALPAVRSRLGDVSLPTFYRWLKAFREDSIEGIVPRWGMSPRNGSLSDIEKGCLEYWYLSQERRSASHCWRLLLRNIPDSGASYSAALRYLNGLPRPYVDRYRLGKSKFDSLYQPYVDRDPTLLAPMEQVVSDHHNFDFVVERDGRIIRPWITAFQDYRSGKILGWCPSVYPSSLSIAISLYRMVAEFGAAALIHIDNGKDYRSKAMNGSRRKIKVVNDDGSEDDVEINILGAFGILGSDVTYAKPYHGMSKGRMERTFGIFAEYFSKDSGTYVGSNTVARPEDAALLFRALNGRAKRHDIPSWESFAAALEEFIPWWNASWRGDGKGLDGMTADEAFASAPGRGHRVDDEALLLALTKAQVRRVHENGVRIGGVDYWAQDLFEWSGRDVIVRLPVGNPELVIVQEPKGRTICTARARWFADTGDIARNNETVNAARKANLETMKRFGVGRIVPPDGGKSLLEIAEAKRLLIAPVEDENLPVAAGGEDMSPPRKSRYKSPLDVWKETAL